MESWYQDESAQTGLLAGPGGELPNNPSYSGGQDRRNEVQGQPG